MLRFFILLLSSFFLALFQSAVLSELLPNFLKPDLMLVVVTYLAISPPLLSGAALVFFCGILYDSFSGSPFGLFLFTYLSIFFLLKFIIKFLILGEKIIFRMVLVALAIPVQTLFLILLPLSLGIFENLLFPQANRILPQILVTCAACWPLFHLAKKLDATISGAESSQPVP